MGFRVSGVRGGDQKLTTGQTLATPDATPALAADLLIPGYGRLYSLTCYNTNAAARYFLLFDSATAVANGSVPEVIVKCLSDDDRSEDYLDGILFKNGIYIVNSTTSSTLTKASADSLIRAQFRLGR